MLRWYAWSVVALLAAELFLNLAGILMTGVLLGVGAEGLPASILLEGGARFEPRSL